MAGTDIGLVLGKPIDGVASGSVAAVQIARKPTACPVRVAHTECNFAAACCCTKYIITLYGGFGGGREIHAIFGPEYTTPSVP